MVYIVSSFFKQLKIFMPENFKSWQIVYEDGSYSLY